MARLTESQAGGANVLRFLDLIAFAEGTQAVKGSDDGYNVLFGRGLFTGYLDHPRQKLTFPINGNPITSTAAGRYQLLARYWDAYRVSLRLTGGFTPENQDRVAIQQIRERRALDDIRAGRIESAIARCSNIWASFPGNNYGQNPHKLDKLIAQYQRLGGGPA
ncbi:glycoside hydrolase family 104 protein [Pseudomonas alloputida]|uniref:Glycoside hydrolase family 104 protein n=1 Tax=Pseudomonas alloputida TaxID=1940621 RepID=A0AAW7HF88_9PSED|nr:glycoside hydrolase family 104 protein [Pseudomonas alloputida]MCE0863415.1 glycoside hydrolase family 104 protein [Pseudomonas alloputida]MCE0892483.1 glycoside hydrolase family 104 protein [Pseudomonas alloputida]MCE0921500.1 glycoside hydrolase family 104 protein [Pseudomonas alloputida]MCE1048717.1 glycoside hydrolase family 104 protein [Pseudomonas alloputida]MCE1128277.1 glycoside hydrolase family 104 protein [Pseudomonas alloputida]